MTRKVFKLPVSIWLVGEGNTSLKFSKVYTVSIFKESFTMACSGFPRTSIRNQAYYYLNCSVIFYCMILMENIVLISEMVTNLTNLF